MQSGFYKILAISAGEDKDFSLGLSLSTNSFGEPVHVQGVDVLWQLDDHIGFIVHQVPLEDLMIITAWVQLIGCGPT